MATRQDASGESSVSTGVSFTSSTHTAMAWFMINVDRDTWSTLFDFANSGGDQFLETGADGVTIEFWAGGANVGSTLTVGTWYHVAVTQNGTTYTVYLNGVSDINVTVGGGTAWDRVTMGNNALGEWLNGTYAYAKAWDAVLSVPDIQTEMMVVQPRTNLSTLQGWWPLFSGDRVADWSGQGNTLTENGTLADASPPPVSWGSSVIVLPFVSAAGDPTISVSDSITLSEAVTLLIPNLFLSTTDGITVSETVAALLVNLINVTDSITVSEVIQALLVGLINVSDGIAISETVAALLVSLINVTDSITVSEVVQLLITSFIVVSEGISISETVNIVIAVAGVLLVGVSDTIALSETVQMLMTSFINVSDGVSIAESVGVVLVSLGTLVINALDTIAVSESAQMLVTSFIDVSDGIALNDVTSVILVSLISVLENISVAEATNELVTSFIDVSETISISEIVENLIPQLFIGVSESISISDAAILVIAAGALREVLFKGMFKGLFRNMR